MANGGAAMAGGGVSAEWGAYRRAIKELYGADPDELIRAPTEMVELPAEKAIDETIKISNRLGAVIFQNLDARVTEQRELAMLQLLAAAAVDFSIAHDLARHAEGLPEELFEEPGLAGTLGEVIAILEAPPETGIWGAIKAGGAPPPPADHASALRATIDSSLTDIRDQAGATATVSLGSLLEMPASLLLEAASRPVGKLFGMVDGSIQWILRKAVKFVLNGIAKLLAVFGRKADAVRGKVAEWAGTPLGEQGAKALLERLYRTGTAGAELRVAVKSAGPGKEKQMLRAVDELKDLETKFHMQMQTTGSVVTAIGRISPWLLAAASLLGAPWAPLVLATVYTGVTGYVVFAGGDYIDWPNQDGGLLDLVPGVRSMVSDAIK